MTGYYTQRQFGKLMLTAYALLPVSTQRPTISWRLSPQEEEKQRTTATAQQLPTMSRRSSPNEVTIDAISPTSPYSFVQDAWEETQEVGGTSGQANLPGEEDSVLPPACPSNQQI